MLTGRLPVMLGWEQFTYSVSFSVGENASTACRRSEREVYSDKVFSKIHQLPRNSQTEQHYSFS